MSTPRLHEINDTFERLRDPGETVDEPVQWLRENSPYLSKPQIADLIKATATQQRPELLEPLRDHMDRVEESGHFCNLIDRLNNFAAYSSDKARQVIETITNDPELYRRVVDDHEVAESEWGTLYERSCDLDDPLDLAGLHEALYPDMDLRSAFSDDTTFIRWTVRLRDPATVRERLSGYDPEAFGFDDFSGLSTEVCIVGQALFEGRVDIASAIGWPEDEQARNLFTRAISSNGQRENYEWYVENAPDDEAILYLFGTFFDDTALRSGPSVTSDYNRTGPLFDELIERDLIQEAFDRIDDDGPSSGFVNLLIFARHLDDHNVMDRHEEQFAKTLVDYGSTPGDDAEKARQLAETGLSFEPHLNSDAIAKWLSGVKLEPLDCLLHELDLSDKTYERLFEQFAGSGAAPSKFDTRQPLRYLEDQYYKTDNPFRLAKTAARSGGSEALGYYLDRLDGISDEQRSALYEQLLHDEKAGDHNKLPGKLSALARRNILPDNPDPTYRRLRELEYFDVFNEFKADGIQALAEKRFLPSQDLLRELDAETDGGVSEIVRPYMNRRERQSFEQKKSVEKQS